MKKILILITLLTSLNAFTYVGATTGHVLPTIGAECNNSVFTPPTLAELRDPKYNWVESPAGTFKQTIGANIWTIVATDPVVLTEYIKANNWYWNIGGVDTLLLGGSSDDNIFQMDSVALKAELDDIVASGGNYIRNIFHTGGGQEYPHGKDGNGKFDLNTWNQAYWDKVTFFMNECKVRNIIVQVELWNRFQYVQTPWTLDSYHPDNNINYTNAESGLADAYPNPPNTNENKFFYTPPTLNNNSVVLPYQEAQIAKLMGILLTYDNVMYVIDNEHGGSPLWSDYWANFIQAKATTAGKKIHITEMWDEHLFNSTSEHKNTWDKLDNPYSYTDISQNNHNTGDTHYGHLNFVRGYLSKPVPMNNVKVYGHDGGSFGSTSDAVNRFWLNLVGGCATVRFHRIGGSGNYGLGLNALAKQQIASANAVNALSKFVESVPDLTHTKLANRSADEAYLMYKTGASYFTYFYNSGNVDLDMSTEAGEWTLRWLNLDTGVMTITSNENAGGIVNLTTPTGNNYGWVAVLTKGHENVPAPATNYVTNGDFTTDLTGWAELRANNVVENGKLKITSTANYGGATQVVTGLTAGTTYTMSGTQEGADGYLWVLKSADASADIGDSTGTGSFTYDFQTVGAETSVTLYLLSGSTSSGSVVFFDNVKVEKK